jgi:hypothetical protein
LPAIAAALPTAEALGIELDPDAAGDESGRRLVSMPRAAPPSHLVELPE